MSVTKRFVSIQTVNSISFSRGFIVKNIFAHREKMRRRAIKGSTSAPEHVSICTAMRSFASIFSFRTDEQRERVLLLTSVPAKSDGDMTTPRGGQDRQQTVRFQYGRGHFSDSVHGVVVATAAAAATDDDRYARAYNIIHCLADRTQINVDVRGIRRFITATVVRVTVSGLSHTPYHRRRRGGSGSVPSPTPSFGPSYAFSVLPVRAYPSDKV